MSIKITPYLNYLSYKITNESQSPHYQSYKISSVIYPIQSQPCSAVNIQQNRQQYWKTNIAF